MEIAPFKLLNCSPKWNSIKCSWFYKIITKSSHLLIKVLGCLLVLILFARRLLCPQVAAFPGPNKSSDKEALLSHISLLRDSAIEFFSDVKIHIDLLIISGKKYFYGVCFGYPLLIRYFRTLFSYSTYFYSFFFPFIIAVGDAVLMMLL